MPCGESNNTMYSHAHMWTLTLQRQWVRSAEKSMSLEEILSKHYSVQGRLQQRNVLLESVLVDNIETVRGTSE